MIKILKDNLRVARELIFRMRRRGLGLSSIFLHHLPAAACLRLYGKIARVLNARLLNRTVNYHRFRSFLRERMQRPGTPFFVIVMPRTLHFLLPCLDLLPNSVQVALLINGAPAWEQRLLARRFPKLPQLRLATLPNSSLAHGDMLNLMLENGTRDFGILDHDMYVFDPGLFDGLRFQQDECMLAVYEGISQQTGFSYPLTHFLYFNVALLRGLMQRYGVDANLYRSVPLKAASALKGLGLDTRSYLKDYHTFFDTLHLLLALAYAEGLKVRFLDLAQAGDAYHVGGTSLGSHHTKDLVQLYIHASFLELEPDPEVARRYGYLIAPFASSTEIRRRLPPTPEVLRTLDTTDRLVERLRTCVAATNISRSRPYPLHQTAGSA